MITANYQDLTSVGIEVEGTGLSRDSLSLAFTTDNLFPHFSRLPFEVSRDASVEFVGGYVLPRTGNKHVLLSSHTSGYKRFITNARKVVMGYELISYPMEIDDIPHMIYPLTMKLASLGEFVSRRASIHFHVGFPHNLRLMKNLLAVSLYIDPVLFRLGGAGGVFRGNVNNCTYSRPLMNSCVVSLRARREDSPRGDADVEEDTSEEVCGNFIQIINPQNALHASSIDEFWASFGVDTQTPFPKYHPSRYCGINFYSILAHRTIEFRHMNQSLDALLICTMAKFLREIVDMSTLLTKQDVMELPITPSDGEISVEDASQIIHHVHELAIAKEVENTITSFELGILLDTIAKSSFTPIPKIPMRTHIADFVISPRVITLGKLNTFGKAILSTYMDIHNIEKEDRLFSIFS
jgi:hypothetical protein